MAKTGLSKSDIRRLIRVAYKVSGLASAAVMSATVQDQRIRNIISMRLTNVKTTADTAFILQADALSTSRTTIDRIKVPANSFIDVNSGDLETPLYVLRPTTGTTTASGNNLYIKSGQTAYISISVTYWDEE